ncbi:tRNA pseudouridine(55) synthase TruB [Oceaniserpentilla sp. 4NH20-0058]|uniref:tRNA pseudouridine(55) synthase TruB n=1 Tax=Oceaniserpentilla sp. 4NH20-0058 TaxID=3127660 RepID=UPI00310A3D7C
MARKKKGREISGILVIDKPPGMTSNAVLQKVKWLYQAQKAGHTGALDPIATGVLPICLGEATKFSQRLLDSDKRYTTRVQLGESRDTADIEGEILETASIPVLTEPMIEQALAQYRGEITQVPPMYSALKHEGKKLYELAREGVAFDIQSKARKVTIHKLELVGFGEDYLELDVTCSKGTYIRSLAEDVAKALGTLGFVAVLRRLAAGPYQQDMMITLDALKALKPEGSDDYSSMDNRLLPTYTALESVPIIQVTVDQARDLQFGRTIKTLDAGDKPLPQVQLRLCHNQQEYLVGFGEMNASGVIALKRLVKVPELASVLTQ